MKIFLLADDGQATLDDGTAAGTFITSWDADAVPRKGDIIDMDGNFLRVKKVMWMTPSGSDIARGNEPLVKVIV